MKKLLGVLVLATASWFVVSESDMLAQGKKGKRGTIEIIESKDGKYRFSIRNADGKYLGGSAIGHATEKEAKAAVEEMKSVLATATFVNKKSDSEKGKDKDNDK